MAKRFVDTNIWQKEWYQELTLKEKILVKYIYENCDCAGVWNSNFRMASFIIGETVSIEDLKIINSKKPQFEILEDGKIYIIDFIEFQYGKLSENCKPHKPIIELLKKYGLYERVTKGYGKGINTLSEKNENLQKGINTLEEKEKEKEQEIEKEKDEEKGKNENFVNPDLMFDKNVEKVFNTYEQKCKNCLPLKFERRNLELRGAIEEFLKSVNFDFEYFGDLCSKANSLKSIYENPIDLKAMIKNHERIYSGFYNGKSGNNADGNTGQLDGFFKRMDKLRGV